MSDRKRTKQHSGTTKLEGHTPSRDAARELELHAIEEQFLSEYLAGVRPRLSTYLRRYPDYGAELAAFIALTFSPHSQSGELLLAHDGDAQGYEHRAALSSGTRRALEEIFGSNAGETVFGQSRVAERRVGYVSDTAPIKPEEGPCEQEK